ncbi:MAG: glycosyltransferase family 39 protein [Anaerolineae bacterium]
MRSNFWARDYWRRRNGRIWTWSAILLVLLLAFALRVYGLDGQSLWGDEGWSLEHAQGPLTSVLPSARSEGTMPPLYYLLLHFWLLLTGRTEFALRFPSLFFGVLTVSLICSVGQRLGRDLGTGLVAAFIAALSPFYVYYSQEARMYALMTLFSLLSMYIFLKLLEPGRGNSLALWLGYVVSSTLAIYSYYLTVFVLLAQGLFFLIRWRHYRRLLLGWLGAQGSIFLLFFPWLLYAMPQIRAVGGSVSRLSVSLSTVLERCLVAFSLGPTANLPEGASPALFLAAGLIAFFLLGVTGGRARTGLFLFLYLTVPVLSLYIISFKPMPGWVRYFMAASPAFYLIVADGTVAGARALGWSTPGSIPPQAVAWLGLWIVIFGVGSSIYLHHYYFDPSYARHDHRSEIRLAEATVAPEGGIILNDWPSTLFFYYYQGQVPYYLVPGVPVPGKTYDDQELGQIGEDLERIASRHPRLWLIKSMPSNSDPNNYIEHWLAQRTYKVYQHWVGNYIHSLYLNPDQWLPAVPANAYFGEMIQLAQYQLSDDNLRPGQGLALSLLWRCLKQIDQDYKVFVHLTDERERIWAQRDAQPLDGMRPTSSWAVGEEVQDGYGLLLPADIPPGVYQLVAGFYDEESGLRLPVVDGHSLGDHLLLVRVRVQ